MSRRWLPSGGLQRDGSDRRLVRRQIEGRDVLQQGAAPSWPATLAAARGTPLAVRHLRAIQHSGSAPGRTVFLLDCSASMVASGALTHAKGLLMPWLRRLRRQDTEVVVIGFGGSGVQLRFGPAVPRGWNARWLAPIPGGGGTPLGRGVDAAEAYGRHGVAGSRAPANGRVDFVLLTDGRSDEQPARPPGFDSVDIVVPTGDDDAAAHDAIRRQVGHRQAARLALAWRGRCFIR